MGSRIRTRLRSGSRFSPLQLFRNGEQGVWYDPSDITTLFQDSAGTTPVTAIGQPVGRILDKSGRGNHAVQATAASRPTWEQDASGYFYLNIDGVDDSLATSAINFTTTTKMTAVAGVRKTTDATVQVLVELTDTTVPGAFAFYIAAPDEFAFYSNGGSSGNAVIDSATYAAPLSCVLTGQGDIPGDSAILRINGVQVGSSAADQGLNPYANSIIYIGARASISLFFAGRFYGLIVRGAASPQISSIERYVGRKMGLSF